MRSLQLLMVIVVSVAVVEGFAPSVYDYYDFLDIPRTKPEASPRSDTLHQPRAARLKPPAHYQRPFKPSLPIQSQFKRSPPRPSQFKPSAQFQPKPGFRQRPQGFSSKPVKPGTRRGTKPLSPVSPSQYQPFISYPEGLSPGFKPDFSPHGESQGPGKPSRVTQDFPTYDFHQGRTAHSEDGLYYFEDAEEPDNPRFEIPYENSPQLIDETLPPQYQGTLHERPQFETVHEEPPRYQEPVRPQRESRPQFADALDRPQNQGNSSPGFDDEPFRPVIKNRPQFAPVRPEDQERPQYKDEPIRGESPQFSETPGYSQYEDQPLRPKVQKRPQYEEKAVRPQYREEQERPLYYEGEGDKIRLPLQEDGFRPLSSQKEEHRIRGDEKVEIVKEKREATVHHGGGSSGGHLDSAGEKFVADAAKVEGGEAGDGRLAFQIHGQHGPESYRFGYDTGKGHNRQFRYEERDAYGQVHGRYGFYDKDGKLQIVNYSAHPKHGFSADVPH